MSDPSRPRHPGSLLYLDASALVKLVLVEDESAALTAFLATWSHLVSSAIVRTEVPRAARAVTTDQAVRTRAEHVVTAVGLLPAGLGILADAASLSPPQLRTLDAVHLASALSLGDDLAGMVVYDTRLAEAARLAGITVHSPT